MIWSCFAYPEANSLFIICSHVPIVFQRWDTGWVMPRMARYSMYVHTHFSSRVMILRDSYCIGFRTRFCFFFLMIHGYMLDVFHHCFLVNLLSICSIARALCSWMLHLIWIWAGHLRTWIRGLVALVLTLFFFIRCVSSWTHLGRTLCLFHLMWT